MNIYSNIQINICVDLNIGCVSFLKRRGPRNVSNFCVFLQFGIITYKQSDLLGRDPYINTKYIHVLYLTYTHS